MFFIPKKEKKHKKNLVYLFLIYLLLFLGLYFKYDSIILILIGFVVFLLIFFAEENIFEEVYIKIKKKVHFLNEYDVLDNEIKENNKLIISKKDANNGLNKENLLHIKENVDKNKFVEIRKILPYSILIGLNYLLYVISIISLDEINLQIFSFILQFLFYSFIAGGIISILIIFYNYFKYYNSYGIIFNKIEKIFIYGVITLILFISFIEIRVFLFLVLIFLYSLIKISKVVEKKIFVEKKDIEKIVPGDWIVQDIIINEKIIYSIDNFKLGVNEDQIKKLRDLSKDYPNLNKIYVKDGLAFLPPLFIGFLILLI